MAVLLCVLEHPTQYDAPLWRAIERRGVLRPALWYEASREPADMEIGQAVAWGQPTLASAERLASRLGSFIDSLDERPVCAIVPGWTRPLAWRAFLECRKRGIPIILPSDKTLNEPSGTPRLPLALLHALKNRLFQGFLTTGQLGVAALRSAGVSRSLIATGLYPVDCMWWREQRGRHENEAQELRDALGGSVVVVAVSKMSEREDPLNVIRGFAGLAANMDGARLLFVGDGPLRAKVEEEIRMLGIAAKTRLAGYVRYESLAAYYGAGDIFIHVPRKEPWGISVAEAMACGLPVVASSTVGSAADLVVAGRTGFIVPPGNAAAVSSALLAATGLLEKPLAKRAVAATVHAVDVVTAANEIESLVARMSVLPAFDPLRQVMVSEVRNHWGKWSA